MWETIAAEHDQIQQWLKAQGLIAKIRGR